MAMLGLFATTPGLARPDDEADAEAPSGSALEAAAASCPPELAAKLAPEMVERVQSRYDAIRALRARFVQTNESATFGDDPLMSSEPKRGVVVFAKPGRMRWTYEEPERSIVVSDGETLWIYDVEAASATRFAVTEGFLSGAALQFLLGDGRLEDAFDVSVRGCDADWVTLDLIPRSESTYERLGLEARRSTGDVVATSVVDLFGNRTEIRFDAIEVNPALDPDRFHFDLPDGVELIEYDAKERRTTP